MSFLNDLTLQQIVTRGLAYLLFSSVYLSVLRIVNQIGDKRSHTGGSLAAWGLIMAILFRAGWVLVPSHGTRNISGRVRQALAPLIASACLVAIIPLIDLLRPLAYKELNPSLGQFLNILFNQIQDISVGSAILCLLPWPGLPGAQIVLAMKQAWVPRFRTLEWPAALVLIAIMIAVFDPVWQQVLLSGLSLTR
ncbi:hypothetical protein [Primorskyibacter marinus]|uniref:hypothetical protein n=1 Tax=Primorskyibacter marinus TaxID=1977320 RepID=UPI000E3049C4|nr:hypothetical protein [Primorskyibacter marinus]